MCLLERHAVGVHGVVSGTHRVRNISRKVGQGARNRTCGACPIDAVHGVIAQVVQAHAFSGVGQGHGATALEAPVGCSAYRTIHTARTRRWADHYARSVDIKTVGNLYRHGHAFFSTAIVQHTHILQAGH